MIQKAGIDFRSLDDEHFDAPFAIGSGAGAIFGATGGVMEAALRYAAELILGTKLESVDFPEVRGTEGIKLASYKLGDLTVNVGVASSTGKAKELLNRVKSGELDLQFIEIMGCRAAVSTVAVSRFSLRTSARRLICVPSVPPSSTTTTGTMICASRRTTLLSRCCMMNSSGILTLRRHITSCTPATSREVCNIPRGGAGYPTPPLLAERPCPSGRGFSLAGLNMHTRQISG